jgi:acyl-lipid omega-6 desaturase (Delta-12 desaturase)
VFERGIVVFITRRAAAREDAHRPEEKHMTASPELIDTQRTARAPDGPDGAETRSHWRAIVARYQGSDVSRSITQMLTTLVPLAAVLYVMYRSLALPYWVTLLLALPAGGLLVRTFIIMHDCSHGSFFPTRTANEIVGWCTGLLTLTSFGSWRHSHALHHASSGDLDRRGHGDVDTLTVGEYLALSRGRRFKYRLFRNPFVLFGIGPIFFVIDNRIPRGPFSDRETRGVWLTNVALVALVGLAVAWIGWRAVVLIYAPAIYIAAAAGIWLFYVQHQFEDAYWKDHGEWDYATSAIRGSSYFKLPRVLQWFTGNIGLHHVHHLGPRIPNYKLERCHEENPLFHAVTILTLRQSIGTLRLTLWDEEQQRLVGYRELRGRAQSTARPSATGA